MNDLIACWEHFQCTTTACPAFKAEERRCWLIPNTLCRDETQGQFIEKLELCLDCTPFALNISPDSLPETLVEVSRQFKNFRDKYKEQEGELESVSMEMALGLSEVFEALRRLSDGDPTVRISEDSDVELISLLKHRVNETAVNIAEIVDLSHEFAMSLAEYFDVLVRVSKGDHSARVRGESRLELLEALKKETNQMIESVSNEIAERKTAEELLKGTLADLARSNAELEQFAYIASHDLQEPLRMVSSYVKLLSRRYEGRLDDDADDFIHFAVDGANRMHQLISDLLKYSRMGTRKCGKAPTDFNTVLQKARQNLQAAVRESQAQISSEPLPTLLVNESMLVQLLQNLLGNAIKFCGPDTPRINITHRREGQEEIFSVKDNGIGISPEFHDKIFSLFRRLHGHSAYPGTGIGLSLCQRIVERHSGRIWVASEEGEGATFYFSLPMGEPLSSADPP